MRDVNHGYVSHNQMVTFSWPGWPGWAGWPVDPSDELHPQIALPIALDGRIARQVPDLPGEVYLRGPLFFWVGKGGENMVNTVKNAGNLVKTGGKLGEN